MADHYSLLIDVPVPGTLRLELRDTSKAPIKAVEMLITGHVDNILLTAVDNLVQESIIDRSALRDAEAGPGIDKNSSIYRIVQSLRSALAA